MALYLDNNKRDSSGKIVKDKKNRVEVGNVSRGSAGGYTTGVISGLQPTGQTDIRGQPVYSQPFTPIVPNSSPVLQNTPDRGAGALPNSPLINGYDPSMPSGSPQMAPQPPSPVAPAVPSSSSTSPAGAQGAPTDSPEPSGQNAASQANLVYARGRDGTLFKVDPKKSFISQTGQYQYDFWTSQGQKERLQNALETSGFGATSVQFSGGEGDPTELPGVKSAINAFNAASLIYGGAALWSKYAAASTVGNLASTPQGVAILTSSVPAASGIAPPVAQAGAVVANTANKATQISYLSQLMGTTMQKATFGKWLLVTGVVTVAGNIASSPITGAATNKYQNEYITDSQEMMSKLIATGDPVMIEFAGELNDSNIDLKNGLDQYLGYLGPVFMSIEKRKVDDFNARLGEMNIKYLEKMAQKKIDDEIAANEAKAAAKIQEEDAQRAFQREQQEDQQAFQTSEREARQAYEQLTREAAASQKQLEEDTATTTSEGGTLTFGLLGGNGSVEFVSADKASQAYFDKVYTELTPAQKQLLNLLKGKGGQ